MKKFNKMFSYLLSALLVAIMVLSILPATPVMAASPETYYTTSNDGYLNKANIIGEGWAAVHDAAEAGLATDDEVNILPRIGKDAVNYFCLRGALYYNTVGLPDDAAITSAYLRLYVSGKDNAASSTNFELVVVDGTDLATPMVVADYHDLLDETASLGSITYNNIATSDWIEIPLNTAGLALISKTGVTKFGLRVSTDIDNTTPGAVGSDRVDINSDESENEPELIVYYGVAIATNEASAVEGTTATLHGTTSATSTMRGFEYAPKFTPGKLDFNCVEAGADRVQGTGTELNLQEQSIEVWFIPTADRINCTVFATNRFGITEGIEIKWDTLNNQLGFCYAGSAAMWRTAAWVNDVELVIDELTHIIYTFDSGYIRLYFNGVLYEGEHRLWNNFDQGGYLYGDVIDSSDYPTIYYGSSTGWALGACNGGKNVAHGDFYTIRLYDRALTATEALNNFNDDVTTTNLKAEWEFDEASGTTIADSVGSYTGTLTNPGSGISWGYYAHWTEAEGAAGAYSHGLTSLTADTNYHFRAKATISGTTAYGVDKTFTTTGAPAVQTNSAVSVGSTSATLQGTLTSLGAESAVYCSFEYGTTTSYGTTTADQTKTAIGGFNADVSDLTSNTLYHFRARARYDSVYVYGIDQTFTTQEITVTPGAPIDFKISSSTETSLTLSWTKGTDATNTVVRHSTSGYPTLPTEGTSVYSGTGITTTHGSLTPGTRYYYSAWSETGGTYSATYVTTSGIPTSDILAVPDTFEIETLQIYRNYVNAEDNLIVFSYKILWNEGLPATLNPEDFFYIQVLDGSVVVKQDRIKMWGYVPGSLYVSELFPLEWNKEYTFKIVGTSKFTTPPSVTYSISSSNYIGSNYDYLVTWVLDMASRMQNSIYWDTLIEYDVTGVMLNSLGSQIFTRAIPGLLDTCPSLFYPTGEAPEYTVPGEELDKAESFTSAAEDSHGEAYWTAFENIATMLDVEVSNVVLAFWLILSLFVIIGITLVTGDLAVGVLCAMVPLLIGTRFGGIPMEYVTAAGILGAFIFIYKSVLQHA